MNIPNSSDFQALAAWGAAIWTAVQEIRHWYTAFRQRKG